MVSVRIISAEQNSKSEVCEDTSKGHGEQQDLQLTQFNNEEYRMPDQEMINRVAKAIYNNWANYPICSTSKSWLEVCEALPGQANDFRRKAKAAIKAMREPTTIIKQVETCSINYSAEEIWTKFIDFIIK